MTSRDRKRYTVLDIEFAALLSPHSFACHLYTVFVYFVFGQEI